jgi:hypothetical protein
MISKTVLNVSTSSTVTLARVETRTEKAGISSDKKEDIKDTIDLGVGLDVAERLRNAKGTDDLVSLLKEGQEEAKAAIEKFKALQEERNGGSYQNAADKLFDAVRRTIVDILSEQDSTRTTTTTTVSYTKISFEARLSVYLNEGEAKAAPTETDKGEEA